MKRSMVSVPLALVIALAGPWAAPAAAQTGPDHTLKFLKTVEGTLKAIGESRAQLLKTVTTYNSIIEMTAPDLKSAYKDLGREVVESEKKVAEGRPKVDEMNTAAAGYFSARQASVAAISEPELRKRSEDRLTAARSQFDKIAIAGKDTRQSFDTLMNDAKDQYFFLGHDLNASAIESLKPDAAKFNARAAAVLGKADGVTKLFEEYVASMRP